MNYFSYPSTQTFQRPARDRLAELEEQVRNLQQLLQKRDDRIAELEIERRAADARKSRERGVKVVTKYDSQGREIVSQAEAARILEVSRYRVCRWVRDEKLNAVKVPGKADHILREGLAIPKPKRRRKGA